MNKKNIDKHIDNYNNNKYDNILLNPLYRIRITHIIAIVILNISALFYTEDYIPQLVQAIIALVIYFHDLDDKSVKTVLAKKINNLKEKEEEINKVVSSMEDTLSLVDAYIIYSKTDLNGVITDVSQAFCDISAYTKEELIGKTHTTLSKKEIKDDTFNKLWETIAQDKVWTGEIKNYNKAGDYYWIDSIISPDYDSNGVKVGYTSINHDITARKDFQKQHIQLIESEKMASLGDMIGNIAHQWRQPLNSISTIASGICMNYEFKKETSEEKMIQHMNHIVKNTKMLSDTIDVFTNFIKDDKLIQRCNLQTTIDIPLGILNATLNSNKINIINKIDYTNCTYILMVEGELSQVIINILNNAKDVLIDRDIENPTIVLDLIIENDNAIITLEDNAGGIDDKIISKIFEPYFTTKHKSQGTGLGLHMSYRIINESFKGELYVKNSKIGAKFFIKIPLNKRQDDRRLITKSVNIDKRLSSRRKVNHI